MHAQHKVITKDTRSTTDIVYTIEIPSQFDVKF